MILFVEKLFLRFIAINFHQRALADRLAENRLGLKALDRLSSAHPVSTYPKKARHGKKGKSSGKTTRSISASLDLGGLVTARTHRNDSNGISSSSSRDLPLARGQQESVTHPERNTHHGLSRAETRRRRRKFMASIIVDQVGGAIGQVALKNSKFHKHGELGGLHSARMLAKKLFEGLKATNPERSHLVMEGTSFHPL